jgi:hypothetical protein
VWRRRIIEMLFWREREKLLCVQNKEATIWGGFRIFFRAGELRALGVGTEGTEEEEDEDGDEEEEEAETSGEEPRRSGRSERRSRGRRAAAATAPSSGGGVND